MTVGCLTRACCCRTARLPRSIVRRQGGAGGESERNRRGADVGCEGVGPIGAANVSARMVRVRDAGTEWEEFPATLCMALYLDGMTTAGRGTVNGH